MTTLIKNEDRFNDDIKTALKNSIYPGAKDTSIEMVLSYCRAANLDPLQKPVHIVPMNVKVKKDLYEYRDVIMPGIQLYRIQAARSCQNISFEKPVFGEKITEDLGGVTVTYPEYCVITIKKIVNNIQSIIEVTEFWKENYSPAKKDTLAPNAMWLKRPYAQLAKCAEAQALRRAFPDVLTHQLTAEEMEGKSFDDPTEYEVFEKPTNQTCLKTNKFKPYDINSKIDLAMNQLISEEEKLDELTQLKDLINQKQISDEIVCKWLAKANVDSIDDLDYEKIKICINYINGLTN